MCSRDCTCTRPSLRSVLINAPARPRRSGQLHAIAAKIDAGEGPIRPANRTSGSGIGRVTVGVGAGRAGAGDSDRSNRPATADSGATAGQIDPCKSQAKESLVRSKSTGSQGSGMAVNASFRARADGQLALQETRRRLAKQVSRLAHALHEGFQEE
jgi:hypothetical protein